MLNNRVRLVLKGDFWVRFYQVGFWVLFAFLIGCIVGNFYASRIVEKQLHDATTYKAIEVEGQKYNLVLVP